METLFRWIHLSDIHVGHGDAEHGWDQKLVMDVLRKDIAALAQSKHRPIDAVLVTGDIAFSGNGRSDTEYKEAKAWFDALAVGAGVTPSQIYLVPGNHDVNRGADKDRNIKRLVDALRKGEDKIDTALADGGDRQLLASRMQAYLTFADDFAPARRRAKEPPEARLFWDDLLTTAQGLPVRLVGLNTALLAAGDDDQGKLRLGKAQLHSLTAAEGELVMVLSHHPFVDGWLADQREADAWVRNHAHVHLSGHVHEADAEASRKGAGDVFVRVVAGSVHGDQGGPAGHGYSFGEVLRGDDGKAKIRVYPRKWSPKRMGFVLDVENVQEGELYSEHDLQLKLPARAGATPPAPATPASAPSMTKTSPMTPSSAGGPVPVFISSCPADSDLCAELDKQLVTMKRTGVIRISGSRTTGYGKDVRAQIEADLREARVILLLLSADYLSWDYCDEDLRLAYERHMANAALVIPILLRPVDLADPRSGEVGKEWFAGLMRLPRNNKPVALWPNKDEALAAIAKELKGPILAMGGTTR